MDNSLTGTQTTSVFDPDILNKSLKSIFDISPDLQKLLQHVADDVVKRLGCVGAMVATLETDNLMPVRAYAVDIAPMLIRQLEGLLGTTIVGPRSVSYLDDPKFQENLSVRAVKGVDGQPQIVVSNKLHDLFRPVVNKPLSDIAQKLAGIKQVIAVPFFLEDEVVGNLFAASRREFTQQDIGFLTAFGAQAAVAIKSQRHLTETQALERVILSMQSSITDETMILQTIVDSVVQRLGYAGAVVTTLEGNNTLPVRAYTLDIASPLLRQLQDKLKAYISKEKSVVYLDDESFRDNLSVRAVKGINGRPAKFVVSDNLYDLFRPIIPQQLSNEAQKLSGIRQVIAVPFFLNDEVVGNLFVATRRAKFSAQERDLLAAFGQQAAVGIRNAKLYQRAEEQRQIAQVFAKMAFSAATNIHALRNHIGGFRAYLSMVKMFPMLSESHRAEVLESSGSIMKNLNEAAEMLDSLHEPWRTHQDVPTDVNQCLNQAIKKTFLREPIDLTQSEIKTSDGFIVRKTLASALPILQTSPDMLTESFRIILKNAVEALKEHGKGTGLWLETHTPKTNLIEVILRDDGIGIKPENLRKIFEMGWSTKQGKGMGFGLFWTKDYVEGMGGTIRAESVWQQGTTFYLQFPTN